MAKRKRSKKTGEDYKKEYNLNERELKIYNALTIVFGLASIATIPTGLFGLLFGILGILISVTYLECIDKKMSIGYVLCISGSLLSAIMISYIMILSYAF